MNQREFKTKKALFQCLFQPLSSGGRTRYPIRGTYLRPPGYEFSSYIRLISRTISPFELTFRIVVLKCSEDHGGIQLSSAIIPFRTFMPVYSNSLGLPKTEHLLVFSSIFVLQIFWFYNHFPIIIKRRTGQMFELDSPHCYL